MKFINKSNIITTSLWGITYEVSALFHYAAINEDGTAMLFAHRPSEDIENGVWQSRNSGAWEFLPFQAQFEPNESWLTTCIKITDLKFPHLDTEY